MSSTKIFLASSAELREDRREFESFINEENKSLHDDGVFFELVMWEDFIDALSKTRLQDEYNKSIKESDIFVMLFFTKVGKYTEEEFEIAFGQFKEKDKPVVYTFFKNAPINSGDVNDEFQSVLDFKKKLSKLGHFYTVYKNIDDLKYQFSKQIKKLIKSGFIKTKLPLISTSPYSKELTLQIPRTNPADIIGREEDLNAIHQLLHEDKKVVLVNGLGGIGKTTLAQVYISKYYDEYAHIAWITQSSSSISNDFINTEGLIKTLNVNIEPQNPEQAFANIILTMKNLTGKFNLLVIDNAEQSLEQYKDKLPGQPHWHVLVTSREEIIGMHSKKIGFLSEEEAVNLFKKHYTHQQLNESDIKTIVNNIDLHTLTIEILAKTAEVQRYDLTTLLNAVKENARAKVKVKNTNDEVINIRTYLSNVFNMSKLHEDEIWMMQQFACLPAEFHRYELLKSLIVNEESKHYRDFSETVTQLAKKGWLLEDNETDAYKMHRIVAEVVRAYKEIRVTDIEILLDNILVSLELDVTKDNPVDKFVWIPFGKAIVKTIEEENGMLLYLKNILGGRLLDLGAFDESYNILEKTILINEKKYGQEHPITLMTYLNFAVILQEMGDFKPALELTKKTKEYYEKKFGSNYPETIKSYAILAGIYLKLNNFEEAKNYAQKVLDFNEDFFGKEHYSTAASYSNLSNILRHLGEFERSRELAEKASIFNENSFGLEHPNTASSYMNLSLVLEDLGYVEKAKDFMEKATRIHEKNFGNKHPLTLLSYFNLAGILSHLNDNKNGLVYAKLALEGFQNIYNPDHPYIKMGKQSYEFIKANLK